MSINKMTVDEMSDSEMTVEEMSRCLQTKWLSEMSVHKMTR